MRTAVPRDSTLPRMEYNYEYNKRRTSWSIRIQRRTRAALVLSVILTNASTLHLEPQRVQTHLFRASLTATAMLLLPLLLDPKLINACDVGHAANPTKVHTHAVQIHLELTL